MHRDQKLARKNINLLPIKYAVVKMFFKVNLRGWFTEIRG